MDELAKIDEVTLSCYDGEMRALGVSENHMKSVLYSGDIVLTGYNPQKMTCDLEGLKGYLSSHNIPLDGWGKGGAKTPEHLLKEINEGETVLVERGNEILRQIKVASITVLYGKDDEVYVLAEDRQEFNDGRVRKRTKPKGSLSEKFKSHEESNVAAKRAIREELGITGDVKLVKGGEVEEVEESQSFPGLKTLCSLHRYNAELTDDQYNPAGYVEEQEDKKTYFVWKNPRKNE